jgi:hypothetical protein
MNINPFLIAKNVLGRIKWASIMGGYFAGLKTEPPYVMKHGMYSLKPFWDKLMVDASAKYGKCSHSSDVLIYMRREFIDLVDNIAMDGFTDGPLYWKVKQKVSEADSFEMATARKDEEVHLIEMKDREKSVVSVTAEENRKLVGAKASNDMSDANPTR